VAAAGGQIDVLCFASEEPRERDASPDATAIQWHTVRRAPRSRWLSPLSPLPNVAYRSASTAMRKTLKQLLRKNRWDAIVLDGLAAGWAIPTINAHTTRPAP
ncbi:MAG: hypothetical protein GWO02_11280, partial [Gammaproteobacteria bacterium]|nr:hypothetical protein [Gammaproteobacteria bacterium]